MMNLLINSEYTKDHLAKELIIHINNLLVKKDNVREKLCIAIAGLPALGKTSLIREILEINKSQNNFLVIENKHWSKYNRHEKLSRGLTGLEPESYVSNLYRDIEILRNGGTVLIKKYDHKLGNYIDDFETISSKNKSVILLEGCVWMLYPFCNLIDFLLHIFPSSRLLWEKNLIYRDINERNCSDQECRLRTNLFWSNFSNVILPNVKKIDINFTQYGSVDSNDIFIYRPYPFDKINP